MINSSPSRLIANLRRHNQIWLLAILFIYLLLAMGYNFVTPIFEAPDEQRHFFTIKVITQTQRLPTTFDDTSDLIGQEAAQPPLYYMVGALISTAFDDKGLGEPPWHNPAVQLGAPDSPQNRNLFVHSPEENWPWRGQSLEVHVMRGLSTLFGLGTLLSIYASGCLVWPAKKELALLATALVAFLPQFAFLHASVTNDSLIVFLSALVLWQCLRLWYTGVSWGRLIMLGATLGLAILSKAAGLLLLVYVLGFLTIITVRDNRKQAISKTVPTWFLQLGLVTAVSLLFGGWLLWRNWSLYGDITANNQILAYFGGDRSYSLLEVSRELSGLWNSIFAVFGSFNIIPPPWVYLVWNAIILTALLGLVIEIARRLHNRNKFARARIWSSQSRHPSSILDWSGLAVILLGVWALVVFTGLIRFMLQIHAGQGRLLFPALLPVALVVSYGMSRYRWSGVFLMAPTLALLTSLYCLLFIIPPVYALPPILAADDIPTIANRLEIDLGYGLELMAAQVETDTVLSGERIWLTLYWQAESIPGNPAVQDAPKVVLELLGRNDELIGKYQSYHGGGLYPASFWHTGEVVADRIGLELYEGARVPVQARLNVKLAGEQSSVDVGTIKVVPLEWPAFSDTYLAQIEGIQLLSATISANSAAPGDSVVVDLEWQVLDPPHRELTTFVHLGDPNKPPLAQGDSIPLGGDYPTGLWAAGERFSDAYQLDIPSGISPGRYPIHIGFYDPTNGLRLPLAVQGERQPNDAYQIGWLVINR